MEWNSQCDLKPDRFYELPLAPRWRLLEYATIILVLYCKTTSDPYGSLRKNNENTLMAYFMLNSIDEDTRHLTYIGTPEQFAEAMSSDFLYKVRKNGLLTSGQSHVFNTVIKAITKNTCKRLFFIDGPGGTGNTFLYNTMIEHIRGHFQNPVIVVASSGIASIILLGGYTAHHTFKIATTRYRHHSLPF
ncbi:hypothetical protein K457DRAFT_19232 [Linnemannia elongata AG-77]|uniref:ATP-dependent DNA helicase n=1 Tax=Linnemannia elongata AG-77 TaxID=1314771 RepID=A0A197JVU7_9FUNG|nr:hypothetical protein K457DRAFT_19232 [Linnemannia elongata AG-77]